MTAHSQSIAHSLDALYNEFKMPGIVARRFTQADLVGWIAPLVDGTEIRAEELGHSAEQRPITLYRYGLGPTKVLLWSQMHGDESTATMALADILRFFARHPKEPVAAAIREKLTLLILPMLNPDGAERFTRRTAQHIDMNRDALALVTPEARILKALHEREHPAYGFNLHDQDVHYTVGATKRQTAIALLAPPTDERRTDNAVRTEAKKLATALLHTFNEFVPGHVAKWDDTFESRAFGDNVQRWGTRTVLIESGGWTNDPEKMVLRRLNGIAILAGLERIASGTLGREETALYEALPFNTKMLVDLAIRRASLLANPNVLPVFADVAMNFEEVTLPDGTVRNMVRVVDIGDLSVYSAFEEREAGGKPVFSNKLRVDNVFPATEIPEIFGN